MLKVGDRVRIKQKVNSVNGVSEIDYTGEKGTVKDCLESPYAVTYSVLVRLDNDSIGYLCFSHEELELLSTEVPITQECISLTF